MVRITTRDQFDAWEQILLEWKKVKGMKRSVQELYEQVGGALFFMLDYSKKYNIPLLIEKDYMKLIKYIL